MQVSLYEQFKVELVEPKDWKARVTCAECNLVFDVALRQDNLEDRLRNHAHNCRAIRRAQSA